MGKNDRYVQKRPDGDWEVVKGGPKRASAVEDSQREAHERAREIVKNQGGGEVLIKNERGAIRNKDTIGKRDPESSKG